MTTKQDAAAVEATVAQQMWQDGFGEMAGLVAGCFPRRETRQTFREMTEAMLMGVPRANCWTLAEALGHGGPHRLQHFLARAVWDHDAVRDRAARWVAHQLADDQAVLVVDETGDEKSSTDAVGAARQYSGATWRTPCTGHAGAAVTSTARQPATAAGTKSPQPPPYDPSWLKLVRTSAGSEDGLQDVSSASSPSAAAATRPWEYIPATGSGSTTVQAWSKRSAARGARLSDICHREPVSRGTTGVRAG